MVSAYDFKIDTVPHQGHELTFVSIESDPDDLWNPAVTPPDWPRQIEGQMTAAEHVVVEYFPPEIHTNFRKFPFLRKKVAEYVEREMQPYSQIAIEGARQGHSITTADIATTLAFFPREIIDMYNPVQRRQPTRRVNIQPGEQNRPTPTDARRSFTARAIQQLLDQAEVETSLLYVAAPAHVNRVKRYVTNPTEQDEVNFEAYRHQFRRMDQRIRTYDFRNGCGWVLTAAQDIV